MDVIAHQNIQMSTSALGGLKMLVAHCTRGEARGILTSNILKCLNCDCGMSALIETYSHGSIYKLNCLSIYYKLSFLFLQSKIISRAWIYFTCTFCILSFCFFLEWITTTFYSNSQRKFEKCLSTWVKLNMDIFKISIQSNKLLIVSLKWPLNANMSFFSDRRDYVLWEFSRRMLYGVRHALLFITLCGKRTRKMRKYHLIMTSHLF